MYVCGTVCLSAASLNNSMDEWVGGWMDDSLARWVELHGRWLSEWLEFVCVCEEKALDFHITAESVRTLPLYISSANGFLHFCNAFVVVVSICLTAHTYWRC